MAPAWWRPSAAGCSTRTTTTFPTAAPLWPASTAWTSAPSAAGWRASPSRSPPTSTTRCSADGARRRSTDRRRAPRPNEVAQLDAALAHWADVVEEVTGRDDRHHAGAGAAGGVGFGAVAVLGAEYPFRDRPAARPRGVRRRTGAAHARRPGRHGGGVSRRADPARQGPRRCGRGGRRPRHTRRRGVRTHHPRRRPAARGGHPRRLRADRHRARPAAVLRRGGHPGGTARRALARERLVTTDGAETGATP